MSKSHLPECPKTPERRRKRVPSLERSPASVVDAWNMETGMSKDKDAQRLKGLMDVYELIEDDLRWSSHLTVAPKLSVIRAYLIARAVDYKAVKKEDGEGSSHIVITTAENKMVTKVSKEYLNTMALLLYVNLLDTGIEPKENFTQLIQSSACPDCIKTVTLQQAKQTLVKQINRWEEYEARYERVEDGIDTRFIASNSLNPVAHVDQEEVSVVAQPDHKIVNAMLRLYREKHRFVLDPSPANWATHKTGLRLLDTKFAIQVPGEDDGYVSDHSSRFICASRKIVSMRGYLQSDATLIEHNYAGSARLRRLFVSLLALNKPPLLPCIIHNLYIMGDTLFKFPKPANASQYCVFSQRAEALLASQQGDINPGKKSRLGSTNQGASSGGSAAKQLF